MSDQEFVALLDEVSKGLLAMFFKPMTVQAMKAGAVEFLTKPFDDDVLLTTIRHAIERSSADTDFKGLKIR